MAALQTRLILASVCVVGALLPVHADPIQRVTAKKGPIELTLEIASSTIGTGSAPWIAVQVRNVGKETITIVDELFSDRPSDVEKAHGRGRGPGVYFELKGPDGQEVNFGYPTYPHECLPFNRDPELGESAEPYSVPPSEEDADSHFARNLAPGEIIRTRDFVYEPMDPRRCGRIRRSLLGPVSHDGTTISGFQELGAFRFRLPGKYKLRAIYDMELSSIKKDLKELNIERDPEEIKTKTGWITIRVVR